VMKNTAIITGGNKGIGADLASALLALDYTVVSLARNAPEASHKNLHSVSVDLLDPAAVAQAAAEVAQQYEVTHLVHNAGLIWPNLIEDASPEDITGLSQLHLGSALTLLKAFLPTMKKNNFGRVMFNGSRAALGAPTRTAYGATKAGMVGMARTNVVAPGPILTDNFWGIIDKDSPQQEALAKRIAVGRLGNADDVTRTFLFFCDPANSFVTGQTLYVCGGSSVGSMQLLSSGFTAYRNKKAVYRDIGRPLHWLH